MFYVNNYNTDWETEMCYLLWNSINQIYEAEQTKTPF